MGDIINKQEKKAGVLYIVTDVKKTGVYLKSAIESAKSVRQHSPLLGIHIYGCSETLKQIGSLKESTFDSTGLIENPHYRSKVDYMVQSPFELTLYLDSDTRVCDDITEMFGLLGRFDIALAHAHRRNSSRTSEMWTIEIPQSFPQFNSGVFLYRKTPSVCVLLKSWGDSFHESGFKKDQVTLRELIWKSDLRIATLPPEYNMRFKKYIRLLDETEAKLKILHMAEFHGSRYKKAISKKIKKIKKKLKSIIIKNFYIRRHSPNKVFGIGFHKTGTTSLANALEILGYKTIHGDIRKAPYYGTEGRDLVENYINKNNYNLPTFNKYDAFTDNPYFSIWKELIKMFPNGKYILTVRDENEWLESCVRYFAGRRIRPMRVWMFKEHADPSADEQSKKAWLEKYRNHNKEVINHFKSINKELLIMDISKGEGWDLLCPFLSRPIPPVQFPHKKQSDSTKN